MGVYGIACPSLLLGFCPLAFCPLLFCLLGFCRTFNLLVRHCCVMQVYRQGKLSGLILLFYRHSSFKLRSLFFCDLVFLSILNLRCFVSFSPPTPLTRAPTHTHFSCDNLYECEWNLWFLKVENMSVHEILCLFIFLLIFCSGEKLTYIFCCEGLLSCLLHKQEKTECYGPYNNCRTCNTSDWKGRQNSDLVLGNDVMFAGMKSKIQTPKQTITKIPGAFTTSVSNVMW